MSIFDRSYARERRKQRNPAFYDAIRHASYRANQAGEPTFIFVARAKPFNTWFVRVATEGRPAHSRLFKQVNP